MDKSRFVRLLRKYTNGKASTAERQFVISYYNMFESDPDVLALLSSDNKERLKNEMHTAIMQNVLVREKNQGKEKKVKSIFQQIPFAAAAAIVIMVGLAGMLFVNLDSPNPVSSISYTNETSDNKLVRLKDGSSILMSPGSKITYSSAFPNLPERTIHLRGQAFFDIKPNAKKPFLVITRKLQTKVLGTSFNIKADPTGITVTVVRGKVKVSDEKSTLGLLTMSQQINYDIQTAQSSMRKVDTLAYVDWKSRTMVFNDASVKQAIEVLEKQYNVDIVLEDASLGSKRFTTTFEKSESLDQVLKSICEFNDAVYRREVNRVIITNK